MATIPTNPSDGDTFTDGVGATWTYNSSSNKWLIPAAAAASGGGGSTTEGDVGTYAWLRFGSDIGGIGSTHAGSGLQYAGVTDSVGNNIITIYSGTPSGTWRLMGHGNGGFQTDKTSLFVRIS